MYDSDEQHEADAAHNLLTEAGYTFTSQYADDWIIHPPSAAYIPRTEETAAIKLLLGYGYRTEGE